MMWVLASAFGRDRVGGVGGGLYEINELTVTTNDLPTSICDFGDDSAYLCSMSAIIFQAPPIPKQP